MSADCLDQLAQQLKLGRTACRRAIERILAMTKKTATKAYLRAAPQQNLISES
jgi:hypothetical protein